MLVLVYKQFLHTRSNGKFPRTTWKCLTIGCSATVTTLSGKFLKAKPILKHEHAPHTDNIVQIELNMRLKLRVQTDFNLSPRQIYTEERKNLMIRDGKCSNTIMEDFSKAKSRLYDYRQSVFPTNPKHRSEIELIGDWRLTLDKSETFLLADDGVDKKILIFGTETNLRILCNAEYIVSDGTFSVHPSIFSQLYVFHAPYLCKVLPMLFCLLPDKSYNTYCRLIELIKKAAQSIGILFDPKHIHIVYEMAMIKAISVNFSSSVVQGCLFHFCQCIWRKVQELGIATSYQNNRHIKQWVRRFSALPLLPVEDIDNGWIAITESSPYPQQGIISSDQIENFHLYMLNTWIHDIDAIFDKNIWNQFRNSGPRTTNNAEGWNNKLNHDAKTRLSFFQFVNFLQNIQVDLDASKFNLIASSPSRRNKYKLIDQNLETAKQNYMSGNVPILDYLDSVSCTLKLE